MVKITIFRHACKGVESCGICSFVCPKDLFRTSEEMNEAGYLPPEIDDESECTVCENCMIYCPDLAIVVEKESEATSDKEDSEAPRGPVETGSPLRSDKARGNRAKASKDE